MDRSCFRSEYKDRSGSHSGTRFCRIDSAKAIDLITARSQKLLYNRFGNPSFDDVFEMVTAHGGRIEASVMPEVHRTRWSGSATRKRAGTSSLCGTNQDKFVQVTL